MKLRGLALVMTVAASVLAASPAMALDTSPLMSGFEGGMGPFTVEHTAGSTDWSHVNTDKHSGARSAFAQNPSTVSDQRMISESIAIPADATSAHLTFFHNFNTESAFDGGVLEFAVDGGAFQPNDPAFVAGGYNAQISTGFSSLIAGRHAWSGSSGGFVPVDVDLGAFTGHTIRFRFRMVTDNSNADPGWWVDDVDVKVSQPGGTEHFTGAMTAIDQLSTTRTITTGLHPTTSCDTPTPYPGTTSASNHFRTFALQNNDAGAKCVTVNLSTATCNLQSVAYFGAADPASPATNYLGDAGKIANSTQNASYSFLLAAGARSVLMLHNRDNGAGAICADYDISAAMPPPETNIDSGPGATITTSSAQFGFSSPESSSKFACSLDGAAFAPCGSPMTVGPLLNGSHSFSVEATDANGVTDPTPASQTFTVAVPPAAQPDVIAPVVSALGMTPKRLHALAHGASIAVKKGARVSYTVSEAGTASFRVERLLPGKKVKKRCVKPTGKNRKAKSCKRAKRLPGGFSRTSTAGTNSFTFTGALKGKGLKPGKYNLVLVAKDAAGNAARAKRIRFRVVR
jgi:hypothetical protein